MPRNGLGPPGIRAANGSGSEEPCVSRRALLMVAGLDLQELRSSADTAITTTRPLAMNREGPRLRTDLRRYVVAVSRRFRSESYGVEGGGGVGPVHEVPSV